MNTAASFDVNSSPSNQRLERAVRRLWLRAASAERQYALAAQVWRRRAAAQLHR